MNKELSKIGKEIGLALVIVMAMLLPRIFALDKFVTTDETIWLMRSSNFYYALGQRDYEETYRKGMVNGVVTMWVETAAYLIEEPQYRTFGQGYFSNFLVFNRFIDEKGIDPLLILSTARVIMVVLLSIVIGLAFILAKRMIGVFPAMVGFLMISFDPWYLALSRISHLDAPQATFQFISVLAIISFFYFRREPLMLLLSGFFGGIAFLSKLPGLITGPVIAFLATLEYLQEIIVNKTKGSLGYFLAGLKNMKILIIWIIIFFLSVALFWPIAWDGSVDVYKRFIQPVVPQLSRAIPDNESPDSTESLVTEDSGGFSLQYVTRYLRENILLATTVILLGLTASIIVYRSRARVFKDQNVRRWVGALFWFIVIYTIAITIPPISIDYYTRYLREYFWHTTPVIMLGLLASIIAYRFKMRVFDDQNVRNLVSGLFWFIAIYTIAITIPAKWSARYYLPVHLCIDLIAGIGLVSLSLELSSRLKTLRRKNFSYGLAAIFMVVQLAGVLPTFPYYFSYFNPLLGGGKKAAETILVGVGEGLNLVGEYLNGKPDAENLTVMSWFGIGPLSFFFEGKTVLFIFTENTTSGEPILPLEHVDYLVIYNSQRFRPLHKKLIDLIADVEPEHSVWINDIEYARIYKVSDIKDLIPD